MHAGLFFMKSPIWTILDKWKYEPWDSATSQYKIRNEILALGIDGIVDVQFTISENSNNVKVTPVFATEKDWVWYNLKYDSL